ncbi:MAG TPA: hypothetical protein VFT98_20475 [Myxococcota bacterium]|nr:hypothetical protein [Myxococcota bacterium]
MIDFPALFAALARHDVRFILVGGAAATAHGSARLTQDLDLVYDRAPETCRGWSLLSRRMSRICAMCGQASHSVGTSRRFVGV